MKRRFVFAQLFLIGLLVITSTVQAADGKSAGTYQTGFKLWRSDFGEWDMPAGVVQADGAMVLDWANAAPGADTPGAYKSKDFYNGGSYRVGEVTGPWVNTFAFQEAIASWNADTPPGTWIETQVQARIGTRETSWYNLGVWAADTGTVERHSVNLQGDADGYVAVDTLVLAKGKMPATGLRLKVRLFSEDGTAVPVVRNISLAYSGEVPKKLEPSAGNSALWNTVLSVPECSQMVYPDGGEVWCSPTSTSMVLGYWNYMPGVCGPRVQDAVAGVFDWVYDGHGNWPFNTAYAASRTGIADHPVMEGYVRRYASLADLEPWIKAGVPVVMSIAWSKSELTGAAVSSSNGHLVVLVGFDAAGNAVVNDPAASTNEDVQRTYLRGELESVWLQNSGGTVYLIFPKGWETPGL